MIISNQESVLTLAGDADLRDAAQFNAALMECLDRGEPAALHLEGLETVDVPVLQLVEAARRAFAASGVPLTVHSGAGAFHRAWMGAGMPPLESEDRP